MQQGNSWDIRFAEPGFAYGVEPNDFLVESSHYLMPEGNVLCLAEGEGRNGVWLAGQGFAVSAIDSSAVGLQKAADLARSKGLAITTLVADLADYQPLAETFDGIISIFCHLPPAIRKPLFNTLHTSLKKDGILILEGYTKKQLEYGTGGPPEKEMLFDREEITSELNGFEFLVNREIEREIFEGKLHNGLGSVVQIIGRKISS